MQILIEPLIYGLCVYLSYLFIKGEDMVFSAKLLMTLLFLPFILFLFNNLTLLGVNLVDCTAIEGPISLYYTYFFEITSVIVILRIFINTYIKIVDFKRKKEIRYFVTGIIMFLLAFSWGNLIGSFTDNWNLAQAGLIGMPIFFGFLAYISVKFKTFNLKIIGAQVLVFALGLLVASISFVSDIGNIKIISLSTLIVVIILGYQLIRGVRREIKQKERLQELSLNLEKSNLGLAEANEKLKGLDKLKTEFLSLASHQLRTPLTAIKGYASMLSEGAFGKLDEKQDQAVKRIYTSAQGLANVVEDLLNVSKIEQGGMKYEFSPTDLSALVTQLYGEMKVPAESKNLQFRRSAGCASAERCC
jgi:signal transduction histidine kinase